MQHSYLVVCWDGSLQLVGEQVSSGLMLWGLRKQRRLYLSIHLTTYRAKKEENQN